MKRTKTFLGWCCALTMTLSANFADAQVPGAKQITADEYLWLQLVDEPYHHMQAAREQFLLGDRRGAADELRTSAVYLRISSQNSPRTTRPALLEAATDLENQAIRVQAGTLKTVNRLDQSFARAEYALARHHHAAATESWSKQQARAAGLRIQAATTAAERASVWTGHKVSDGAKTVYSGARSLGGGLVQGSGYVVDQVGRGFESVGKQIGSLGQKISPE